MGYIHWIQGRQSARAVIDLESLSYEAVVAVMNALNPHNQNLDDFACEADKQAFSDASCTVAQRWSAQRGPSVGLS
jgi:hypothetical protein